MAQADKKDPLVGAVLAGYILKDLLGKGGSANVYRGINKAYPSRVRAIKVLHQDKREQLEKRFVEEARLLEKLQDANIVKCYELIEDQKRLVMVLELLEGATLRQHLDAWREAGTVPPLIEVLEIIHQACLGIAHGHLVSPDKPVVHRDVKPDNLFVTKSGMTKVLDFGVAMDADAKAREALTTTNTAAPATYAYVAPELLRGGQAVTPAADVYALGITLFEAIAGHHPFRQATTVLHYTTAHLTESVPRLKEVRPDVPEALDPIIQKATEKAPLSRYATAKEFAAALREVQDTLKAQAAPPAPPPLPPSEPPPPIEHTTAPLPPPRKPSVIQLPKPSEPDEPEPKLSGRTFWKRMMPVALGLGLVSIGGLVASKLVNRTVVTNDKPDAGVHADATDDASIRDSGSDAGGGAGNFIVSVTITCPPEMVFVPSGSFKIGSDKGDANENGGKPVTIAAFCMDETEVTVAAYKACVEKNGCKPAEKTVQGSGQSPADVTFWSQFCNANLPDRDNHPINCVDWTQADTYCKAMGKDLPTEQQWEYAARGTDGRMYPWGNQAPDHTRLNACGPECVALWKSKGRPSPIQNYDKPDGFPETAPVKSFPRGKSAHQIFDMAGNVWEWTKSDSLVYGSESGNKFRVIRGGSWSYDIAATFGTSYRESRTPSARVFNLGFRCARTPVSP